MDRMKGILGEEMSPSLFPPREADPNDNSTQRRVDDGGACGGDLENREEVIDPTDKNTPVDEDGNKPEEEGENKKPNMHGFYSEKNLNELLKFACLIKERRNELEIVGELIPIKLREETKENGTSLLSMDQMDSLKLLFKRVIDEKDMDNRLICLKIVRDFLFTYEDEFINICDPEHRIAELVDKILDNHIYATVEEDPKEVEFGVLMEISEWVERCMGIIDWLKPYPKTPTGDTIDNNDIVDTNEPDVTAETNEADVTAGIDEIAESGGL